MPLSDEQWTTLARELRRATARVGPGWTDANTHDPGVTVLEVLAYALDELAYHSADLSADARAAAERVAKRAAAIASVGDAGTSSDVCSGGGLRRPRYFAGQLVDADDLNAEQDYVRARLERLNRLLNGSGVVDGLAVTVEPGAAGPQVVVAPGLALDRHGREIFVDGSRQLALPASGTALLVQLAYREQLCDPVPVAATAPTGTGADDTTTQATRIVETFAATLAVAPSDDSVDIARVRRVRGRWRIDPAFEPARTRR